MSHRTSASLTVLLILRDGDTIVHQTHNNHHIIPRYFRSWERAEISHSAVVRTSRTRSWELLLQFPTTTQSSLSRLDCKFAPCFDVYLFFYRTASHQPASAWLLAWGHCWAAAEISSTRSPGELAGWVVSDWRRWP